MAENGKIRMPESGNPSLPPPTGSFYLWLSTDGFFKKMDSAGNVSNLSAQSIEDLNDVDLTGLQDGQGIAWNESQQKWEPVTFPEGGGDVESVNGKTGAVVLDPDDLDDSATDHKFASQSQLDQITTNAGDISSLETDVGSLEAQVNTNTNDISSLQTDVSDLGTKVNTNTNDISANATNIALNATNIAANANAISANASDISDLQDQIDGGVGKTYTGVEAIEINNTDDQISLKLSEDTSGQYDSMSVSLFNDAYNHNYEVVKRHGRRVNIGLDLLGERMVINYDSGDYQLYRSTVHDDRFIGFCEEIGYWIAVSLNTPYSFNAAYQETITVFHGSWVQLGTACTVLPNGNKVPSSQFVTFTGENSDNSYLEQSTDGLKAKVASDISTAEAFQLADALDVRTAVEGLTNRMDLNAVIISGWRQFDVSTCVDFPEGYQFLDEGPYVGAPFGGWRRVGESMEITFAWRQSGQYTSDNRRIYFSLPDGLNANWAAIPPKQGGINITAGVYYVDVDATVSNHIVGIESEGNNAGKVMFYAGAFIRWSSLSNNAIFMGSFSVPVQEWTRTGIIYEDLD